jgi:hypothetical protein
MWQHGGMQQLMLVLTSARHHASPAAVQRRSAVLKVQEAQPLHALGMKRVTEP